MIVHDEYEQGSIEWLHARVGIPTASEFSHLVTPKKLEIVTGAEVWKFVSYRHNFPKLILNVHPNAVIQEALWEALALFHEKLNAGWDHLCELNNGPPPPRLKPETMVFADDIAAGRAEENH